eukprot:RCo046403
MAMADAHAPNLLALKVQQEAVELQEKARLTRRRGAIVLMLHFLLEHGYLQTLEKLQQESGVSLQKVCAADNMDLLTVLQEYEDYIQLKFGHKPKFFRNLLPSETPPQERPFRRNNQLPSLTTEAGGHPARSAPEGAARGKGDGSSDTSSKPALHKAQSKPKDGKPRKDDPKGPSSAPPPLLEPFITGLACGEPPREAPPAMGGGALAEEGRRL